MNAKIVAIATVVALATASLYAGSRETGGAWYNGNRNAGYAPYKVGTPTYRAGTYYRSGAPRAQRSDAVRREFLRSQGYSSTPQGYEVDHILPLSRGGADATYNMQLLTVEAHRVKTRAEVSRRAGRLGATDRSVTERIARATGRHEETMVSTARSFSIKGERSWQTGFPKW
jgi:hypothetical protein